MDSIVETTNLLEHWDKEYNLNQDISKIVELEKGVWYKSDPDPFDDRHPGRADPNCILGHVMKVLFKNDNFMSKLVSTYMTGRDPSLTDLHINASRLLLDIMPGLETTVIFQENETLVRDLIEWTNNRDEPLSSYAVGLLASAMEIQDVAASFKECNAYMVPKMMKKLIELKSESLALKESSSSTSPSFSKIKPSLSADQDDDDDDDDDDVVTAGAGSSSAVVGTSEGTNNNNNAGKAKSNSNNNNGPSGSKGGKGGKGGKGKNAPQATSNAAGGVVVVDENELLPVVVHSDSCWDDVKSMVIGKFCMAPLSLDMKQRLILMYLQPMGEYQELVGHVYEHQIMDLLFYYIDLKKNKDVRLAFEALKYLAALLCHKRFAIDFLQAGGIQKLLEVRRPSVAATGVSMCLYYLAYFDDPLERMYLLPHPVLTKLVDFALWLLECSHESGRVHATMFFGFSFLYRVIVEIFDQQDGLRKLFNLISTLRIMNLEENRSNLTDDELFTNRQSARHVVVAIRRYLEAHVFMKSEQVKRMNMRTEGGTPLVETPANKPLKFNPDSIQDSIELLLECMPNKNSWKPVNDLLKLGAIQIFCQLLSISSTGGQYSGKVETLRSTLDSLAICCIVPKAQLALCNNVKLPDDQLLPGISILLDLASGEHVIDPEVQKAALGSIINSVCGPLTKVGTAANKIFAESLALSLVQTPCEDPQTKVWQAVRSNNGIMVLMNLLSIKLPMSEADAIRAMACRALVGLSRCHTVKQIISKLPMFSNGQLQQLMWEPVLQDKRSEHAKFCKFAIQLIQEVSGKLSDQSVDPSLERMRKADIVAQTKIVFNGCELLKLIHAHLIKEGLTETAASLEKESKMDLSISSSSLSSSSSSSLSILPVPPSSSSSVNQHQQQQSSKTISYSAKVLHQQQQQNASTAATTPASATTTTTTFATTTTAESMHYCNNNKINNTVDIQELNSSFRKHVPKAISLSSIVTTYLQHQHTACKNPVIACPPFSLLNPHKCPEPKFRTVAPSNITSRLFRRQVFPRYGGLEGGKLDRKFIYSRFRPLRSFRDAEENVFSCCSFSADEEYVVLGLCTGELKMFNISTAVESNYFHCHSSPVIHCEPSRDGELWLTSSAWGTPLSALWKNNSLFDMMHAFNDDEYAEFSKLAQDRIVGTKDSSAQIYDVTTGLKLMTLYDANKSNNYTKNRATFNPTDDLILNDGVLWDIDSGKVIHKFDKFNSVLSGLFHPNGLEIIINSQVWDVRTFHLLHTVEALDQCKITFNKGGKVIYGAVIETDDDDPAYNNQPQSSYGRSFRTFDGTDYSNIATIDVKKLIFDLCTDSSDCYLAVVENLRQTDDVNEESCLRLYEIGKLKDGEDDQEEEENGEDDDDEDDDDDDSVTMTFESNSRRNDDDDDDVANDDEEGGNRNGEGIVIINSNTNRSIASFKFSPIPVNHANYASYLLVMFID
ncbi:hypothetical protein HELRODRAFT_67592 [Helobdella robusta]|uniref:DDB1- and CUL4-associated factor 1 n=1 Tax=Helobdella robusta TaxID=6412 RepID=T1FZ27_HELRO|nr:hypothetical protein HELRODRAFT_67592 [Helobdella robusta]ESN96091.1 hypothetical protein HELRODRAFT_67592 [Helobdella robusta]